MHRRIFGFAVVSLGVLAALAAAAREADAVIRAFANSVSSRRSYCVACLR